MSRGYVLDREVLARVRWVGGFYISGVDFGYFSTSYRDCEALKMREE